MRGQLIRNPPSSSPDRKAGDILTPRVDLAAVSVDRHQGGHRRASLPRRGYSRLPVYRDSIDNIVGVLHQKDFHIAPAITDKATLGLPSSARLSTPPASELIGELLQDAAEEQDPHWPWWWMSIGGTVGIVTMEDILEELVGEIWDEHDEVELPLRRLSPDCFLVDAGMDLEDFQAQFPLAKGSEMVSVGGWVMEQFGRVPGRGTASPGTAGRSG